jgi:uracil-DNA glycosylase
MTDTPQGPTAPSAQPRLDPRHNAMLSAMGVATWWDTEPPTSHTPPVPERRPTAVAPVASAASTAPTAPQRPTVTPARAVTAPPVSPPAVPRAATPVSLQPLLDMRALEEAVRACTACGLSQQRRHAVPGVGDAHQPDWLVVGEAPGEEEDRQGVPFVGRAGQLLDRMLAAMGLTREEKVYIANVIKCRPPQNRNPEPDEVAQCTPYLLRQVELLQPRMVLAMGRFAAQTLLAQGSGMSADALRQIPLGKLRGRVHTIQVAGRSYPVVVTYHPAYLLRSPAEKAKAWADLCLAMDTADAAHQP